MALHTRGSGTAMRILSGLAGKMAPVAGPPGKAVPTPSAAFTAVHRRVAPVSQLRRGESRGGEVQQLAGAAVAPHSGSIDSQASHGNKSCSSSCSLGRDAGGVERSDPFRMEERTVEGEAACSRSSSTGSKDVGSNNKRGSVEQQSVFNRGRSRGSRVSHLSRKSRGSVEQQQQPAASRSSSSRVRQYRKRVCVRWGSLHWSLALVLVVRSAATGCQRATDRNLNHATTPRTVTVA